MEISQDPYLRIVDSTLTIPGVRGTHVLLHVSDTHLCVWDEQCTPKECENAQKRDAHWMQLKEDFARQFGEPFGDAQRITTAEGFGRLLAFASAAKPEALILTGDNLDYMHPAGQRLLAGSLSACGVPYLCVPGNHEYDSVPGVWEPDVRVLESDGFRIVGIDDRKRTVTDADLARLEALAAEGIPMILAYHIPVATDRNRAFLAPLGEYFSVDCERADENGKRFVRFVESCPMVKMTLCGHIHGYSDTEIAPGKRQITASQGMIGFIHRLTVTGGDV